jgi:hypothetical protein
VNHFARVLDGIGWDAAAVSVAQKDAGSLGKLGAICGLGDATPHRQQLERNDYEGSSWTHGGRMANRRPEGPVGVKPSGRLCLGNRAPNVDLPRFGASFFGH